jgi:hypothetical protein
MERMDSLRHLLTVAFILAEIGLGVALLRRSLCLRTDTWRVRLKTGVVGLVSLPIGLAAAIVERLQGGTDRLGMDCAARHTASPPRHGSLLPLDTRSIRQEHASVRHLGKDVLHGQAVPTAGRDERGERMRASAHLVGAVAGYRNVVRSRSYFPLWLGQFISNVGDVLHYIALVVLVYRLTGHGLAAAGLVAAEVVPVLLLGSVAGVIIDRLSRKAVLIAADLFRAALALSLVWPQGAWQAYLVAAGLLSADGSFFNPTVQAVIPALTTEEQRLAANSVSWSTAQLVQIVGAAHRHTAHPAARRTARAGDAAGTGALRRRCAGRIGVHTPRPFLLTVAAGAGARLARGRIHRRPPGRAVRTLSAAAAR